ncbi:MAG: DUF2148 domain-containing protein [archaeon]
MITSEKAESEALLQAATLMLLSARTAPKSGGVDDILTMIVTGEEKNILAAEMEKIADERKNEGFRRDGRNLRNSEATVLVGVRGTKSFGLNCGSCGCDTCKEFDEAVKKAGQDFSGPTCVFKALDLGIAVGSAVKTASLLNVDNRIMYRIGAAARRMNLMAEGTIIMGIPISAKGKSIYFDRQRQ